MADEHRSGIRRRLNPGRGGCRVLLGRPVFAATIVGTPKNEVLRGTAMADKLYGGRGNDKLYGLAGNDLLVGGPGDDLLVGGPGRDIMQCGPGRDAVVATKGDNVAVDCEVLKGLPAPALSIGDAAAAEGGRQRVDHDVYGAPVGAGDPGCLGQLLHRRRDGDRVGRLHSNKRQAHVRAW